MICKKGVRLECGDEVRERVGDFGKAPSFYDELPLGGEVGIDVGLFSFSELSEVYTIGGADGMSLDLSATCDSKDDSSVALLV